MFKLISPLMASTIHTAGAKLALSSAALSVIASPAVVTLVTAAVIANVVANAKEKQQDADNNKEDNHA